MPLLVWIILFTAVGGIASAAFAGLFLLVPEAAGRRLLPHFVSYATGALLGAALLALLPEAMEGVGPDGAHSIGAALLVGLGVFFVIEKLVLWWHTHGNARNGHGHHAEAWRRRTGHGHGHADDHERHAHGRGPMIMGMARLMRMGTTTAMGTAEMPAAPRRRACWSSSATAFTTLWTAC